MTHSQARHEPKADTSLPTLSRARHQDEPFFRSKELTDGHIEVIDVPGDRLLLMEEPDAAAHVAQAAEHGPGRGAAQNPSENWNE
ncbi:hypothetical protein [Streptomyces abikoensis]|uniref:Uncharacterized protein n=1 Tax=Streptomyces abikoensis TaxID=97398 RepID=A0ABW7T0A3_9ACTN